MSKIFTFLEERDDNKLQQFAEACRALGADGITIFTHKGTDQGDGYQWALNILGPDLAAFTWIPVIGTPFLNQFVLDLPQIDKQLLTTGIAGAPAHRTSLLRRVFIPMGAVNMPRSCSRELLTEDQSYRRLEDRVAGNTRIEFLNAVETPIIQAVIAAQPAAATSEIPESLNSDESTLAKLLLSGKGIKAATGEMGITVQLAHRTTMPQIRLKYKEAGMDFDALWFAAKAANATSVKSEETPPEE